MGDGSGPHGGWRRPRAVAAFLAVLAVPAAVAAFVLQGPHALELMIDRLGRAERLAVVQVSSAPEGAGTSRTVRYAVPDRLRIDTAGPGGGGRPLVAVGGDLTGAEAPSLLYYHDLFLLRHRDDLVRRLRRRGVDPDLSCLGRYAGHVALVVGARRVDEAVDQVWIDKETWRPLRWIDYRPEGLSAGRLEVDFPEWRQTGSVWYPARIVFLADDQPPREIVVQEVRVNPDFPPGLFAAPG